MILKLALDCIEGIADRNVQVLVGVMLWRLAAHDNLPLRYDQLDADVIEVALVVASMMCLHHNAAHYDPIEEALELGDAVADFIFGSDGWLHVAESNA
jgi:hypothetical protein